MLSVQHFAVSNNERREEYDEFESNSSGPASSDDVTDL
jgi:hypothetical protein